MNWSRTDDALSCDSGNFCYFQITHKLNGPGCALEVISPLSLGLGVAHENTFCSASISGYIEKVVRNPNKPCHLAPSTVSVVFNSGVNSAFNGQFNATATYVPTEFSNFDVDTTKSGVMTVEGTNILVPNLPVSGIGDISFQTTLDFFENGLLWDCTGNGGDANNPVGVIEINKLII